MSQVKHQPATPLAFGIGYGFIVTAHNDGSIPLSSKALAKIEPGGDEAIREMQRRANAYPKLVEALRVLTERVESGMLINHPQACSERREENSRAYTSAADLLRELGEAS